MLSKIKITTLCENSAPYPSDGVLGEHGLSMLLEIGNKKILFDTGAGFTLLQNAKTLNIDLAKIDKVVLSHGHYDHTGGLKDLLQITGPTPVYAHPDVFQNKYHLQKGKEPRKIGIPWPKEELESLGAKFHLTRDPQEIEKGVIITGEIPRIESEEGEKGDLFYKNPDGSFAEDILRDDQAIILEGSSGTIVLLGCAHAGLINTLRYASKLTGKSKIYACYGGMHLVNASAKRLDYTVRELKSFDIQKLAPCHCTGFKASCTLFQAFKENYLIHTANTVFVED
ncbi:MAG: MBL fold metallo-hydrolase [Firmicutes bacterium]|nr:MBL fold metallo-hydrolase [Bacillota bacterium]